MLVIAAFPLCGCWVDLVSSVSVQVTYCADPSIDDRKFSSVLAPSVTEEIFLSFYLKLYLFIFRERGREGEGEGEKQQCERDPLSCCPDWDWTHSPGMGPAWNQTGDHSLCWTMPNQLNHVSQGKAVFQGHAWNYWTDFWVQVWVMSL